MPSQSGSQQENERGTQTQRPRGRIRGSEEQKIRKSDDQRIRVQKIRDQRIRGQRTTTPASHKRSSSRQHETGERERKTQTKTRGQREREREKADATPCSEDLPRKREEDGASDAMARPREKRNRARNSKGHKHQISGLLERHHQLIERAHRADNQANTKHRTLRDASVNPKQCPVCEIPATTTQSLDTSKPKI